MENSVADGFDAAHANRSMRATSAAMSCLRNKREQVGAASAQFPLARLRDRVIDAPLVNRLTQAAKVTRKLGISVDIEGLFHSGFCHVHGASLSAFTA